jgi:hypothetical protein
MGREAGRSVMARWLLASLAASENGGAPAFSDLAQQLMGLSLEILQASLLQVLTAQLIWLWDLS